MKRKKTGAGGSNGISETRREFMRKAAAAGAAALLGVRCGPGGAGEEDAETDPDTDPQPDAGDGEDAGTFVY
ncbi:MAG: twin-arginine translocation signal domain-containing protein [Pseudomonadota bacterium]